MESPHENRFCVSDITVNVSHGDPVRLLAEISENNPEEGGSMIIRIHAIDQAGNRIEVPCDEVSIKCTAGSVSHLAADTHELSIDRAGDSHSCNVYWDDLVAQRFFDVEAVLFGGGLGDSNTGSNNGFNDYIPIHRNNGCTHS